MKRLWIGLLCLMACLQMTWAQEGIRFENLSFAEALTKAKAEGKRVFIDCYTKTCGPCKYMAKFIFPQKECGDYFNPLYVCIMKDMEEGDGLEIAKRYKVRMYPTYLIVEPDGTLCAFFDGGAVKDPSLFVQKIKDVLMLTEYNGIYQKGHYDDTFFENYVKLLKEYDGMRLRKVLDAALPALGVQRLTTAPYWIILKENLNRTDTPLFRYVFDRRKELAARVGQDEVSQLLTQTYTNEFRMMASMDLDWNQRMNDLQILEKEGYADTKALQYQISFHQIVSKKQTERIPEIRRALDSLTVQLPDANERVAVLKELSQLPRLLTDTEKKDFHTVLILLCKDMTPAQNQALKYTLSRFEAK